LLPPPRKVKAVEHQPSLAWAEVPNFMAALMERRGMAALALRFAILCASRTGEVRLATWAEIDVEAKIWTIPGKRMKAGKIHRVPLSEPALAVLAEVAPLRESSASLLFPGAKSGKPLSDMSLSMLVRGMTADALDAGAPPRWRDAEGRTVVPHGFRSTFKGWSLAQGWADHLSEIALAHTDKDKVRAAYARAELVEERRAMMDAWGKWCSGERAAPSAVDSFAQTGTGRQLG
jgi:integrase